MNTAVEASPPPVEARWDHRRDWPEDSIGHLMEPPSAVFPPDATVDDVVSALRPIVGTRLITYCYVVDLHEKLLGVVTMRDTGSKSRSGWYGKAGLRLTLTPWLPVTPISKV